MPDSGLYVATSTLRRPEPFRSKQFIVTAEANGVQSKVFSVFFYRELGFFVHLGYFSPSHALIGRYVTNPTPGTSTTIDLTDGGKASVLRFKYSHHKSGQAHFSLTGKLPAKVRNKTTPLELKLGHVFTAIFGGCKSFASARDRDVRPPSSERTTLNFRFDDLDSQPGKIIGWWYPLNTIQIAELGDGHPGQPKQVRLKTKDGRDLPGFLVAPPLDWDWTSHALLIAVDPILAPKSSLDAFLLFQGGVSVERDEQGNDLGESFIAALFTDRTGNLDQLTEELGTWDSSKDAA